MMRDLLMGVDIGTHGSKGVLVSTGGQVVSQAFVDHGVDTERVGQFEQDADEVWWGDLKRITKGLAAQRQVDPRSIAGVGISALCPDMLPVDETGQPLRKAILYHDTRAEKERHEQLARLGAATIAEATGQPLHSQCVGPKIAWFRDHEPDLFGRTWKILTASSFLVHKLTGQPVLDYGTACGFGPLFDIRARQWNSRFCRELGLSVDMLPNLCQATQVVGEVSTWAAGETGLAEGTPVIAGTCDTFAGQVGVGVVEPGEAVLIYGSSMDVLLVLGDDLSPPSKLGISVGVVPGTLVSGTTMTTAGSLTRWFRDNFGQIETDVEERLGLNAYHLLSDQAAEVACGSAGLLVFPHFAGAPYWDPLARGCIVGLTPLHSRKHVYRALLEGIAYGLRHNLEAMQSGHLDLKRIVSVGGGTRSRVWTQIVSNVTGRDQEVVAHPSGAAYGDAFLAGYGVGLFRDPAEIRERWVRVTDRVRADAEAKNTYDKYYAAYERLYDGVKETMHALAPLSALD